MVSVADEQGRLVLMGVDATYCVVDEVDTTASTLHDHYLQQAIEDAETNANEEAAAEAEDSKDALRQVHDPFLKEAIKKAAEEVALKTDLLMKSRVRRKIRGSSPSNFSGEVRQEGRAGAEPAVDDANRGSDVASGSSLLRAALLCQPVSLREPGNPGRLSFCLQRSASGESELQRNADVADSSPEAGSEDRLQDSAAPKPKTKRPKTKRKTANPRKSVPKAEADVLEVAAADSGVKVDRVAGKGAEVKSKSRRPREKPYQCGVCSRWFGCKSHVVEHMRTHTGEKPFQCPLCHKRFSQKSNIYQHMNTHTQQRPFRCNDCGKDFMYRGSLYKHKRLHTGERPYTCGICERRFTHASQLFEHLRTHTNERPFKCSVCGRAFAHSGTMHRHQRNHFSQVKGKGVKGQKGQEAEVTEVEVIDVKAGQWVESEDLVSVFKGGKDINHNSELYTPRMDQEMESGRSNCHTRADAENQNTGESAEDSEAVALASTGGDVDERTLSAAGPDQRHQQSVHVRISKTGGESGELGAGEFCDNVSSTSEVMETTTSVDQVTSSVDTEADLPVTVQKAASTDGDSGVKHPSISKLKAKVKLPRAEPYSSKHKSKVGPKDPSKPKRTRIETPDRKVFSCNICGHSFCHKRSVKRHKLDKHPDAMEDDPLGAESVDKDSLSVEMPEVSDQGVPEEAEEGKEPVDSKETVRYEASLLKSLLTMSRMNCHTNNHQGSNVPDLAALGIRALGGASASLQAIAQICSQEQSKDGSGTASTASQSRSLPKGRAESPHQGSPNVQSAGESSPPKLPKLCIKVEPDSGELPEYSVSTLAESTTAMVLEGALPESGDQTAMQSVIVKMEPDDDY